MKTCIFFLFIFFSLSCMPKAYEYKYISLEEVPDIRILSHGRATLSGLKFDSDMPTRYEIIREGYILIFELDKKNHWPSILIGSKSFDGASLTIEEGKIGGCGSFDNWGVKYEVDGVVARRYVWSPAFSRNCSVDDNEGELSEQEINFKIKNNEEVVIGEETLPFILKRNGTYYEVDAI